MSLEEENLNDLLKSIMEDDDESNHLEINEESTEDIESIEETLDLDDLDFAIQELDIDDIDLENLEFDIAMDLEETEEDTSFDGLMSPDDVDAIFAEVDAIATTDTREEKNVDDDIAEISGLLQSDSIDITEDIEDDEMLALLASMTSDIEESDASFIPDSFEVDGITDFMEETEEEEQEGTADKKAKKEKKGSFLKRLKGRKKSKEEQQEESETETEVDIEQDMDFQPEFETPMEEMEPEAEVEEVSKPAKQNFFSKFLSFLTETDEDDETEKLKEEHGMEPSDENRNILEELDAEDSKKKKKKVRGKKAGKGEADDMEDDESPDADQKKSRIRKKKEKKVKVQKEIPAISSKPEKRISKKSLSLVIGFALTVTVVIIVFCGLIPEMLDKREARDAYYTADYTKAYELLYGKELDNSDTLIFNKSKTILELNRKLASYHNYMGMDMEVRALDALMSAIEKYPELLANAEEYHVTQEVNAIYTTILNILNDRYYITEAVAKHIIAYEDDFTYTRKLESLVYGTPFLAPVEVSESVEAVSDVLPEEQAIIDDNMLNLPQENNTQEEGNSSTESNDQTLFEEEGSNDSAEEVQQEQLENTIVPEQDTQDTQAPSESESQQTPVESNGNSGGQGQLIQGIRQPIDIEIHEN